MTSGEALQLLELTPPFTKAELKKAYRQAQMVWHPDRFTGNDELHAKALARSYLINEAFSEISRALESGYVFKNTVSRRGANYRKVVSKEPPKSAAEFNSRGLSYQSQGKINKAIADFTEAIGLAPDVAVYHRNRAIAYANSRKFSNAITDFTEALRLDSNVSINPTTAHSYCLRGVFYRANGDCKNAITDFTEAIRLDPRVAIFYTQRGITYRQKLEQDKAIADFTEAIELEPNLSSRFRDDFRKYGILCESEEDYDKAVTAYSEVIRSFKEGRSDYWSQLIGDYLSRARAYRLKGDFDNAIADYSEAIEQYPRYHLGNCWGSVAGYYKDRGETYSDKGDYGMAIADLTEAIRRGNKHAVAALAAIYAKSGNLDKATQHQKQFLELLDLTDEEAAEGRRRLALYEAGGSERGH